MHMLQSKIYVIRIQPIGPEHSLATRWVQEWPNKEINRQHKFQLDTHLFFIWHHDVMIRTVLERIDIYEYATVII